MSENEKKESRELAKNEGPGEKKEAAKAVEVDGLSVDQRTVLESLMMGMTVVDTAKTARVSRTTIYDWMKNHAEFQAAYNKWHEMMQESCRARLMTMMDKAASAVEKALEGGDSKAGMQLLKGMGMVAPPEQKSTDPEIVKREAALKKGRHEAKLSDHEHSLRWRPRGTGLGE